MDPNLSDDRYIFETQNKVLNLSQPPAKRLILDAQFTPPKEDALVGLSKSIQLSLSKQINVDPSEERYRIYCPCI